MERIDAINAAKQMNAANRYDRTAVAVEVTNRRGRVTGYNVQFRAAGNTAQPMVSNDGYTYTPVAE